MQEVTRMERELVLNPNEYAFVLDKTKGNVSVYVGPKQASLSQTDQPVIFDKDTKRFRSTNLDEAIQTFATAPEGWYCTLKNPAKNPAKEHPATGNSNNLEDLDVGRKINIQGPKSFALWPGQMVRVTKGHNLRSNQFLTIRVYDDDAAMKNWKKSVMKPQTDGDEATPAPITEGVPTLTMGQLLVIKGTDVSFYIPPTGVEVVRDSKGNYVRDAVTLETLEYCILLSEDGNKRFLRGPDVVFPEPTEVFVEKNGARKFKAIELNELQGVYLKVTAPYTEDDETTERKEGEELFITGKEQMLYFPRAEHAIIMRDGRKKHYAIAIPEGEARYVLDREEGRVSLERGPKMFLADPRKKIIVRRVLPEKLVDLLYPGNREAKAHNEALRSVLSDSGASSEEMLRESMVGSRGINAHGLSANHLMSSSNAAFAYSNDSTSAMEASWQETAGDAAGDEFHRRSSFTPPVTITIDSKYDGVVSVSIWTGYAMLLVRKNGERRVVEGPRTVLLEYDEFPEILTMSTGKPKTTDHMFNTVYLRTRNNKISDVIKVETKDLCDVQIKVSHRVDFIDDDPEAWFGAENYVKILCDHVRSIVRKVARGYTVKEFYAKVEDIVRDAVLGAPEATEDGKTARAGRTFAENNMQIYDIEVLSARIGNDKISALLTKSQHDVVESTLLLDAAKRRESIEREKAEIDRRLAEVRSQTEMTKMTLQMDEELLHHTRNQQNLEATKIQLSLEQETAMASVARDKTKSDYKASVEDANLAREVEELRAKTISEVQLADAVNDDLVAALNAFGDKLTLKEITQSMAPMAYIGDTSIAGALQKVLAGTRLSGVLGATGNGDTRKEEKKVRRDKRRDATRTEW